MKKTITGVAKYGLFFLIMAVFATLTTSCHTPKEVIREVPVYLHDTTRIVQRDTVRTTDTLIKETETIVRETNEADSALLASLGIKLKDNERAILILKTELLQKIRELEAIKSDSTYHHDETPVTIHDTEIKEVETELTGWQKFLQRAGLTSLILLAGAVIGIVLYFAVFKRR